MRLPITLVLLPLALSGATDCRSCHPRQAAAHAASPHGLSLRPIAASDFARSLPDRPIGEARGGYLFEYQPMPGGGLKVTASRGADEASGLIEWAFGVGRQGVTPVVRVGSGWFEHRISYYPLEKKFDLTMGHAPGASASALEALGMPQKPDSIAQCFGCHTTNFEQAAGSFRFTPGVQCARCHPGAERHATGAEQPRRVERPVKEQSVAFCAACHRLQPPGDAADPLNIRFQPYRLVMSRCYQQAELTCLTCHDPHQAASSDHAGYNAACQSCHRQPPHPGDCVACHMPRSRPHPYLAFTDHYIQRKP
jgi:hypothetical protein